MESGVSGVQCYTWLHGDLEGSLVYIRLLKLEKEKLLSHFFSGVLEMEQRPCICYVRTLALNLTLAQEFVFFKKKRILSFWVALVHLQFTYNNYTNLWGIVLIQVNSV